MKDLLSVFLCLLFLTTNYELSAQEVPIQEGAFPDGISIEYGKGSYAVTDEFISREKYSGFLPYIGFGWMRWHETYIYGLNLNFRSSSNISNHNVSSNITQFSLGQGFLYRLPSFSFLPKACTAIGPSTEIFVYANKQEIAVSGFDYSLSFAVLLSLGFSSEFLYPLSQYLALESSLSFSILSLGVRMIDMEESDESLARLLTALNGVNASWKLGVRYYLVHNLSVKVAYLFCPTYIGVWEPLRSASDNLVLALTYRL